MMEKRMRPEIEWSSTGQNMGFVVLRDQFAMAALTGLLSDPTPIPGYDNLEELSAEYGRLSYLYADAMLAARGGK